jgi:hypothetical protein
VTETVDDEHVKEHAALLGQATLVWNDCHYMVLSIFHTLSGVSWEDACATFFEQKTDHNRRGITKTLMKKVLNTKNDEPLREKGAELLDKLGELAAERNLATHAMWVAVGPKREIQPNPSVPRDEKLEDDFKSQFSDLRMKLTDLFHELRLYQPALRVHRELTAIHQQSQ